MEQTDPQCQQQPPGNQDVQNRDTLQPTVGLQYPGTGERVCLGREGAVAANEIRKEGFFNRKIHCYFVTLGSGARKCPHRFRVSGAGSRRPWASPSGPS